MALFHSQNDAASTRNNLLSSKNAFWASKFAWHIVFMTFFGVDALFRREGNDGKYKNILN